MAERARDLWGLIVYAWFVPGGLCATTLPGHELDIGPVLSAVEWELTKWAETLTVVGDPDPEESLRTVLDSYRRNGVPAVRAWYDEDDPTAICIEVAAPAGHG